MLHVPPIPSFLLLRNANYEALLYTVLFVVLLFRLSYVRNFSSSNFPKHLQPTKITSGLDARPYGLAESYKYSGWNYRLRLQCRRSTLVTNYQATRRHISEVYNVHSHSRDHPSTSSFFLQKKTSKLGAYSLYTAPFAFPLTVLQPRAGLGLLHGFVNSIFFWGRVIIAQRSTTSLED